MGGSGVVLRRIKAGDDRSAAVALALEYGRWAAHVGKLEYGIDVEAETEAGLSTSLDDLLQPRGRLYVAEVGGRAVGLGGLKPVSDEIAEVKRMYVSPEARGRGLGKAILQCLIRDARDEGFATLRLESAAFMRDAHELYRSFGFRELPPYEGREFESIPGAAEMQVFMSLPLREQVV
jgi:GNAT superfamily N-acetyltransferase